jgi:dienelactone hydrolase
MKHLILPALAAIGFMLTTPAHATVKTQEIDYKDGDVQLQGFLAYNGTAEGNAPGVLIVHEWWGHNDYVRMRAKQLAELGYVAFALDMYGKGVKADDPTTAGKLAGQFYENRELMRSRATAGLNVLKGQKMVDPQRIAAIGYCFGGSTVLELSRGGAPLVAVVSFHGALEFPDTLAAKNIKASVLVCTGADDPIVPPEKVDAFEKQLKDAKIDYEINVYGGAVHAFTNPEADKHNLPGIAYNEKADKRSWDAMKALFKEKFGK